MNSSNRRQKSVSITFRGFGAEAEEVEKLAGISASSFGNVGEAVRPGVKSLLTRSYVIFSKNFASGHELNDMLPALFDQLGGIEHLIWLRDKVRPEFIDIHFDLPARQEEDSQDGYLSEEVIAAVSQLKACISLGFF